MLQDLGYIGLFIGSFLASTVVPFSADALLIGCLAAHFNPIICFALATLGNWLGGLTSYYIGYLGNMDKIEKWFKVKREKLEQQQKYIEKFGSALAFFTWLPFVGDIFAIALGFYKVNWKLCGIWMLVGRAIRFAVWIFIFEI